MRNSFWILFALTLMTGCSGGDDSSGGKGKEDSCVDEDGDGSGEGCPISDCDDEDDSVNSAADEIPGNEVDEDCSGEANDVDGDGHDAIDQGGDDCDDDDSDVNPDEEEVPGNDVDEDCSGKADGQVMSGPDADDDGYDSIADGGDDCDDDEPDVNPGADEVPGNDVDEDCSGEANDIDGDGHDSIANGGDDCDDEDDSASPEEEEVPGNTVDEDCSGEANDVDGDGHDSIANGGDDCDDEDEETYPGAPGIGADGIDQNCDGREECFRDADGDGFGDAPLLVDVDEDMSCTTGFNQADNGDDCDDDDPLSYLGAREIPDDGTDQDCDESDVSAVAGPGIYVDGGGTCDDEGPGTKANPMCTVQAAVDSSLAGEHWPVFVSKSTYVENVDTQVDLHGGYNPETWARSVSDRTALVGTQSVNSTLTTSGAGPVVVSGFEITAPDGGFSGLYAVNLNAPSYLARCNVFGDAGAVAATTYGIDIRKAPTFIADTTIDPGKSTEGVNHAARAVNTAAPGAVHLVRTEITNSAESPTVIGVISHNAFGDVDLWKVNIDFETSTQAKAIYLDRGDLRVDRSVFEVEGQASSFGLQTTPNAGSIEILGSIIRVGPAGGNSAQGAGVQIIGSTAPVLLAHDSIECLGGYICQAVYLKDVAANLYNNFLDGGDSTNFQDRTIALVTPGDISLENNDLVTGLCFISGDACVTALDGPAEPAVNSCDWTGCTTASDNLSEGPSWSDAEYHLDAASPLRDAGLDLRLVAPVLFDIDGDIRGADGTWDIGVDEYVP